MKKAKLKLFVWTDYCPDYTGGLAFAIAKDETEARRLVGEKRGFTVSHWGDLEILELNNPVAREVSGGG